MSTIKPDAGYRFGVTYVGTKQANPVLLAETDPCGNISATVLHQFSNGIRCKFSSQITANEVAGTQLTSEYRSQTSTYSCTLVDPNLIAESGSLAVSCLRRITPKLDLAGELTYQRDPEIPVTVKQLPILELGARYTEANWMASATASRTGHTLCYHHKQQENLQFGVEWKTNLGLGKSRCAFGYQINLRKANMTFRATVDTNWTVGAVMEKKLVDPWPSTFAISGLLNHADNTARFGIGLIVGN